MSMTRGKSPASPLGDISLSPMRTGAGLPLSGFRVTITSPGDTRKYPLPKERVKKPSRQVPFGSTDLSQATQLARHANTGKIDRKTKQPEQGDYGNKGKKFTSRNYAAARYGEKGADDEFIVVGRSVYTTGMHSERQIGIPFLDAKRAEGMSELYTERAHLYEATSDSIAAVIAPCRQDERCPSSSTAP